MSAPESKKQQTDFKSALWPFIINTIVETAQGGGARLGQGPMHLEALGDGGAGEGPAVQGGRVEPETPAQQMAQVHQGVGEGQGPEQGGAGTGAGGREAAAQDVDGAFDAGQSDGEGAGAGEEGPWYGTRGAMADHLYQRDLARTTCRYGAGQKEAQG